MHAARARPPQFVGLVFPPVKIVSLITSVHQERRRLLYFIHGWRDAVLSGRRGVSCFNYCIVSQHRLMRRTFLVTAICNRSMHLRAVVRAGSCTICSAVFHPCVVCVCVCVCSRPFVNVRIGRCWIHFCSSCTRIDAYVRGSTIMVAQIRGMSRATMLFVM